jgi:hypothetical protein
LAEYPSQQNFVKHYQIADWLGQFTWKRPQQPLLQTGSGRQACLFVCVPAAVTCLMNVNFWNNLSVIPRVVRWTPCAMYRHFRRTLCHQRQKSTG